MGIGALAGDAIGGTVRARTTWRRPVGVLLHLELLLSLSAVLWALSVPAVYVLLLAGGLVALVSGLLIWGMRLMRNLAAAKEDSSMRRPWSFLLVPVFAVLAIVAIAFNLPLQARWALSNEDFEAAAAAIRQDSDGRDSRTQTIGRYRITHVERHGDAVLFRESTGGLLSDGGGFAYLPDGPAALDATDLAYDPDFEHLDGPWYTWTANWDD